MNSLYLEYLVMMLSLAVDNPLREGIDLDKCNGRQPLDVNQALHLQRKRLR